MTTTSPTIAAPAATALPTLTDAAMALRSGATTATVLVEQALAAADTYDDTFGVYLTRFDDQARAAATEADAKSPDKPFPVPRNAWDTTRWAGGSSSGSGSGVAAGMFCGAIGTDTGGSIRIPAAFNGITGLKPTFGRVPKSGVVPLGL